MAASQSRAFCRRCRSGSSAVGAEGHGERPGPGARRGWPTGCPSAASQSRAVLSWLPVRTRPAVGAERHRPDLGVAQRRPDGLSRRGVPEPRRLVVAAGDDAVALGAEGHRLDPLLVPQGRADAARRSRRPKPRRPVVAAGQDGVAVGAERDGLDRVAVRQRPADRLRRSRASQSRAVWSSLAVRMVRPSGLKSTARMKPSCAKDRPTAVRRPPRAGPSGRSRRSGRVRPSGLKATAATVC